MKTKIYGYLAAFFVLGIFIPNEVFKLVYGIYIVWGIWIVILLYFLYRIYNCKIESDE